MQIPPDFLVCYEQGDILKTMEELTLLIKAQRQVGHFWRKVTNLFVQVCQELRFLLVFISCYYRLVNDCHLCTAKTTSQVLGLAKQM